jgi:iron complex outermembrane receptor protein
MPSPSRALAWLTIPIACLLSRRAHAQDADWEKLTLGELLRVRVASATGGVELESDVVPANVITLEQSDIAAHNWRSIGEVLQHVPGLFVVDDLVFHNVSVRGVSGGLRSGSRIIKVMLNGVEVAFRPELTALLGPEYIPMEAVKRIEISRGPLSALYGANAFLATVNVITLDPGPLAAQVSARGFLRTESDPGDTDTFGGFGVSGLVTAKRGAFGLLLTAEYDRIDRSGLAIQRTFRGQENPAFAPYFAGTTTKDLTRPVSVFGQVTASTERRGTFTLQGGLQRLDSHGEFQVNSILSHRSRYSLQNIWSNLRHELPWSERFTSTLSVGYAQGAPTGRDHLFLTGDDRHEFRRNFSYKAFDWKATALLRVNPALQVLAGIDGDYERHRALYYTEIFLAEEGTRHQGEAVNLVQPGDKLSIHLTSVAPFLQLTGSPLKGLQLSANGRIDFQNLFRKQYSWRLSAAQRFHRRLVAKVFVGQAFQAPSTVLMFAKPGFGIAGNIVGSETVPALPPLEPQRVRSVELVLSILPFENASIVASVFGQEIREKVEFVAIGLGFGARNREVERLLGGEITARLSLSRFNPYVSATMQRTPSKTDRAGRTSDTLALYPKYWVLAGVGVDVPEAFFHLEATARFVGPRGSSASNEFLAGERYSLAAYTLVDAVARSHALKPFGEKLETRVTAQVRNLLDKKWSEPGFGGIDIPSLGRTFMLGIQEAY